MTYIHNEEGSTYTAATRDDIIAHIEGLLGSEGTHDLAAAMFPILRKECYLTFDGQTFTLLPTPEDVWQSITSDADDSLRSTFAPTHVITLDDGERVEVQLVDGAGYTREEWDSATAADYERQDNGDWTRQGQPFAGRVRVI